MFPVVKYRAVDYLYENLARQKLSISWLLVPLPHQLGLIESYCHTGNIIDDTYRKPWTRGCVFSTGRLITNVSALQEWKKNYNIEDLLERTQTSHTVLQINSSSITGVEIVPSSYPSSQFDTEELHLLMQECNKEEIHEEFKLFNAAEQTQDLHMQNEFVFVDYLAKYRRQLPPLHAFLSRLKTFLVKDPLVDFKESAVTEENIFRHCLTLQNNNKGLDIDETSMKEDFHVLSLLDEETLTLPVELQVLNAAGMKWASGKPSLSELRRLWQLSYETVTDGNTKAEILSALNTTVVELEISPYCPSLKGIYSETDEVLFDQTVPVCFSLECPLQMENPVTPPRPAEERWSSLLDQELQAEHLSPFSFDALIEESSKKFLENAVWQSEKYPNSMSTLMLGEPQVSQQTHQYCPLLGLSKQLGILPEPDTISSDWWKHTDLNAKTLDAPEHLKSDGCTVIEQHTAEVETFSALNLCQHENFFVSSNNTAFTATVDNTRNEVNLSTPAPLDSKNQMLLPPLSEPQQTVKEIQVKEKQQNCRVVPSSYTTVEEMGDKVVSLKHKMGPSESFKLQEYLKDTAVCSKMEQEGHNDTDPLNSFIMLRSKQISVSSCANTSLKPSPSKPAVNIEDEKLSSDLQVDNRSVDTKPEPLKETEEEEREDAKISNTVVEIQASGSQCKAYCLLESVAILVLNKLKNVGIPIFMSINFASLAFDQTRFFLKQQEKAVGNGANQGEGKEKKIKVFKFAALLHILVTTRDLLLTCDLETAVEYAFKAKDMYVSTLGSCLHNLWKKLRIVQFVGQKKHETNPKTLQLQQQMLKWREESDLLEQQTKVLVIIRMDSDSLRAMLIDSLDKVGGFRATAVLPEGSATVDCRNVIHCLKEYCCVVVYCQHVGPDFPWNHFSCVVEYDYAENSYFYDLCKQQNISHMTFKTTLPGNIKSGEATERFESLMEQEVPYVFLTTEGLLNMPDLLQTLESKYNVTVLERTTSPSLQMFGGMDCYTVITVDERTAAVIQNLEELTLEKSSDHIILRLISLSLQYSCCWIIFFSEENLNSEYSFTGKILHNLVLIYSALVFFGLKSEEMEVKVIITRGVTKTARLIRQVADLTLLSCNGDPVIWLDRSWLSISPSEEEKCLLVFPCINPLVAQLMLKKAFSLQWLLSATFDHLQELLPEVPGKVLKHFNDITALYKLGSTSSSLKEAPFHGEAYTSKSLLPESVCSDCVPNAHVNTPYQETPPFFSGVQKDVGQPFSHHCQETYFHSDPFKTSYSTESTYCHELSGYADSKSNFDVHCSSFVTSNSTLPFLSSKVINNVPTVSFPHSNSATSQYFSPERVANTYGVKKTPSSMSHFQACVDSFPPVIPGQYKGQQVERLIRNDAHSYFYPQRSPDCSVYQDDERNNLLHILQTQSPISSGWMDQSPHHYNITPKNDSILSSETCFEQEPPHYQIKFKSLSYVKSPNRTAVNFWDDFPPMYESSTAGQNSSHFGAEYPTQFNRHCNPVFITPPQLKRQKVQSLTGTGKEEELAASRFALVPELKRRRLSFEKVPGRSDGQTRLKFF